MIFFAIFQRNCQNFHFEWQARHLALIPSILGFSKDFQARHLALIPSILEVFLKFPNFLKSCNQNGGKQTRESLNKEYNKE